MYREVGALLGFARYTRRRVFLGKLKALSVQNRIRLSRRKIRGIVSYKTVPQTYFGGHVAFPYSHLGEVLQGDSEHLYRPIQAAYFFSQKLMQQYRPKYRLMHRRCHITSICCSQYSKSTTSAYWDLSVITDGTILARSLIL